MTFAAYGPLRLSTLLCVAGWLVFCLGLNCGVAQVARGTSTGSEGGTSARTPSAVPVIQQPIEELLSDLEASDGPTRVQLQLAVLKRLDAPLEARERACDELIEKFKDKDRPEILGAAYGGKGKVLGDRLDFKGAAAMLEKAIEYGRQCADIDPSIFFKASCNRAVYLSAQGERTEPTKILREAIEFAKPHGDQLDVPFAYAMLGRLAEAAGAVDKAFEYLQLSFEMAARGDKSNLAAQAGISILELALSEQKFELAAEWLPRIEPWVAASSDPRVIFILRLRREDLRRAQGNARQAAEAVQQMIDSYPADGDIQGRGLLYLSVAASHFAAENYQAALEASAKGAEILKPVFRSWTLTQINRAESLFALGKSQDALDTVEELLKDERLAATHRVGLLELKSRILARLERHADSLIALQACRQEEAKRATDRANEVAQFIVATYDGQQREAELAAAKARQRAAEYEADLQHEIALRERTSAANDRFVKNSAILISIVLLVFGLLLARSIFNRKAALTIARREQELNEQLRIRLDQQAKELKEETAARQQLELAVERKFRDEALGKLTGGVAHDFNNLLTVVLHSTDLLQKQNPQFNKDSTQLLDAIHGAVESGSSIVSQLMAYARQQSLEPKPVKIAQWLSSTRTMFRQTIGKSIQYVEDDQSDGASICVDTAQLTTAVINLLANARDAIRPSSGLVQLGIRCIELDEPLSATWHQLCPGRYALFEVQDNGKGMTEKELTHACEPFFTTKQLGSGTGLGLSTVLGFVKQSGGDLRLESRLGGGTTVKFLLPLTTRQPVPSSPLPSVQVANHQSQVLLVEDQEAVRTVLAAGLKSIGYDVTQARHADEAIEIINRIGPPGILLSDVRMPGSMDGVELRRWVLERFPHVRVVLMSGYRDLDSETDRESNITFLQKPVKLQDLHRALSSPLPQ